MASIKAKESVNNVDVLSKGSEVDNILMKLAIEGLLVTYAVDLANEIYGK